MFSVSASVFGDPHFITFDNVEYTFNGKGEFVLLESNSEKHKLNIQGRFEQLSDNVYGEVRATQLTAIAGKFIINNNQHFISNHDQTFVVLYAWILLEPGIPLIYNPIEMVVKTKNTTFCFSTR